MSMPGPESGVIEAREPRWRTRARLAGALTVRVAFDVLVLDAAYETWMSPSPIRTGVVAAAAMYFALTIWVLSKGGRVGGPGWLTDPATPLVLLLGFMVAATWSAAGATGGLVMLTQPTSAVLAGATMLVAVLAAYRLAGPGGVRAWWAKAVVAVVWAYSAAALVLALRARTPYAALLAGDSAWRSLPVALRGATVGAFVLPVAGLTREVFAYLVTVSMSGLFRWMVIFAAATWMAINGTSL
jgi:hypothetical protein